MVTGRVGFGGSKKPCTLEHLAPTTTPSSHIPNPLQENPHSQKSAHLRKLNVRTSPFSANIDERDGNIRWQRICRGEGEFSFFLEGGAGERQCIRIIGGLRLRSFRVDTFNEGVLL
jgi:hypothetical protein